MSVFSVTGPSGDLLQFGPTMKLPGHFALRNVSSPGACSSGRNDNYGPAELATADVLRLSAAADFQFSGLVAQPAGRLVCLYNNSAHTLTLNHEDSNSSAMNRLRLPSSSNLSLGQYASAWLWYSGDDLRWELVSHT